MRGRARAGERTTGPPGGTGVGSAPLRLAAGLAFLAMLPCCSDPGISGFGPGPVLHPACEPSDLGISGLDRAVFVDPGVEPLVAQIGIGEQLGLRLDSRVGALCTLFVSAFASVEWSTSNPAVATIAERDSSATSATLTGVSPGTVEVFARVDGTPVDHVFYYCCNSCPGPPPPPRCQEVAVRAFAVTSNAR